MKDMKDRDSLSPTEPFPNIHLKKTYRDRCLVIGETVIYYGNAGSVHVLPPIPGSPNLENYPDTEDHTREKQDSCRTETKDASIRSPKENKKPSKPKKTKTSTEVKVPSKTVSAMPQNYYLPPLKNVPQSTIHKPKSEITTVGSGHILFRPVQDNNPKSGFGNDTYRKGFKPGEKKTAPRNSFTFASVQLSHGSVSKLIENTKKELDNSTNMSLDNIHFPAVHGATRTQTSQSAWSLPPKVQYINIHGNDVKLPSLNCQSKSVGKGSAPSCISGKRF